MKILTDFLNRWSPWRLRNEHRRSKHHLSLCVDVLSRIYTERRFLGLDEATASLMASALAISDPDGKLATVRFREDYLEVAHPAFRVIAEMFIKEFEATGAKNYITTVFHSAKHGKIEVSAQIVEGVTPAQKNMRLDAEILRLDAEILRLNMELQSLKGTA